MLRLVWKALVPRAVLRHPDQPGVDRAGAVAHRALEQQVARRVGRDVVLEGAEVERLVAVAEVGGEQVAGGAPAVEAAVGAHPGVVAAEAGQPGRRRSACASASMSRCRSTRRPVELLHADVARPGRAGESDAGGGKQEPGAAAVEHLDDAHLAVGARSHHQLRRRRHARRPDPGGGRRSGRPPWRLRARRRRSDRRPNASCSHVRASASTPAVAERGSAASSPRRTDARPEVAVVDRAGDSAGREAVEVELVDPAVAPHLLVGARQPGPGEPLGRGGAPRRQSGGPASPRWRRRRTCSGGPHSRTRGRTGPGGPMLPAVQPAPKVGTASACGGRALAASRRPAPPATSARTWAPTELRILGLVEHAGDDRRRGRGHRGAHRASAASPACRGSS